MEEDKNDCKIDHGPGKLEDFLEAIVLGSRYILMPFGLLLVAVAGMLFVGFAKDLSKLLWTLLTASLVEQIVLAVELVDITMVAYLIWLVSAGGYYVFIDTYYPGTSGRRRPRSLVHISMGELKEKVAGSLIGVSGIYLLQKFLAMATSLEEIDWSRLGALLVVHLVFILGYWVFNRANEAEHHNHSNEEEKKDAKGTH